MTVKINDESQAWSDGKEARDLIDALLGGTVAMRRAGKTYMPEFTMECDKDYQARLERATLFPAYSETIKNMTGRVFYRPINRDNVAPGLEQDIKNIDLQGNDLEVFAAEWFSLGLAYGVCFALVDYPQTSSLSKRADGVVTLQDLAAGGVRPYARLVRSHDVIGWIVERINNADTLTQVRIKEMAQRRSGQYGVEAVERIRVIELDRFEVWEHQKGNNGNEWVLVDEGLNSLGTIPLVPFYTNRTGILTATPPLLELAHLNVKHWQEQSDQDASVSFARVRMVFATGVTPETKISASADSVITLPDGGTIGVVQGSAESVKVGADSLAKLEEQMREAGAKLLVKSSQATKAVAQARSDAIIEQSALGAMAQSFEDAIDQMLQLMAQYRGIEDGGHADVNDDFDALDDQTAGVDGLTKLVTSEIISEETAFNEAKRRGLISNELTWEIEQQRILSGGSHAA